MASEVSWYYRLGRQEFGPVDHAALESLHRSGHLADGAEVRRGEKGVWIKVNRFFNSTGVTPAKSNSAAYRLSQSAAADHEIDLSNDPEFFLANPITAQVLAASPRNDWYFQLLGEEFGPLTLDEICEQCQRGIIGRKDLVRQAGFTDWMPAALVLKLTPFIEAAERVADQPSVGFVSPQRGMPAHIQSNIAKKRPAIPTTAQKDAKSKVVTEPKISENEIQSLLESPKASSSGDKQPLQASSPIPTRPAPPIVPEVEAPEVKPAPFQAPVRSFEAAAVAPLRLPVPSRAQAKPPSSKNSQSFSWSSMANSLTPKQIMQLGIVTLALLVCCWRYWPGSSGGMSSLQQRYMDIEEAYFDVYRMASNIKGNAVLQLKMQDSLKEKIEILKKRLENLPEHTPPVMQWIAQSANQDLPGLLNPKEMQPALENVKGVLGKISSTPLPHFPAG